MTYDEAMNDLREEAYAAYEKAMDGDDNSITVSLFKIVNDISSLIDHGCTMAEHNEHERLKNATKLAGET